VRENTFYTLFKTDEHNGRRNVTISANAVNILYAEKIVLNIVPLHRQHGET